ncbi:MAG: hypothetical protein ABWZ78_17540 [Burkholderiaceae bacterium]
MGVRIGLLFVGLVIAGFAVAWMVTGNRRYLQWSVRLLIAAAAVALLFFAALFIQQF